MTVATQLLLDQKKNLIVGTVTVIQKQKVLVDRAKIHYDKSLKLSPIFGRQNKPKATTCEGDIRLRNLFYQTVFYKIKASASQLKLKVDKTGEKMLAFAEKLQDR